MVAQLVFNALSIAALLFLAFVLWSGVGKKRPLVGRGFGTVCGGLAVFLIWQSFELLS